MSFSAGNRTQARCTRCKDVTSHIVIVVVDNLPVKVECCACGSIHKYHPLEKPKVKKESAPIRVKTNQSRETSIENASKMSAFSNTLSASKPASTSTKTKSSSSNAKSPELIEKTWHRALLNTHKNAKEYSTTVELSLEDLVEHSIFGTGVVKEIVAADKAKILFREGEKVLKCITN